MDKGYCIYNCEASPMTYTMYVTIYVLALTDTLRAISSIAWVTDASIAAKGVHASSVGATDTDT